MVRITDADFEKLVKFLKKEGRPGAVLSFKIEGVKLLLSTVDIRGLEMVIELTDESIRMLPRVTKTDTF